jgi:hypothetical protein
LADALMSAFAMFSLKDLSLLAFDHRRHNPKDNFRTISGINRVPCDSQMRDILDPIDPANLRAPFRAVFRRLQRGQVLKATGRIKFTSDTILCGLRHAGNLPFLTMTCEN